MKKMAFKENLMEIFKKRKINENNDNQDYNNNEYIYKFWGVLKIKFGIRYLIQIFLLLCDL